MKLRYATYADSSYSCSLFLIFSHYRPSWRRRKKWRNNAENGSGKKIACEQIHLFGFGSFAFSALSRSPEENRFFLSWRDNATLHRLAKRVVEYIFNDRHLRRSYENQTLKHHCEFFRVCLRYGRKFIHKRTVNILRDLLVSAIQTWPRSGE